MSVCLLPPKHEEEDRESLVSLGFLFFKFSAACWNIMTHKRISLYTCWPSLTLLCAPPYIHTHTHQPFLSFVSLLSWTKKRERERRLLIDLKTTTQRKLSRWPPSWHHQVKKYLFFCLFLVFKYSTKIVNRLLINSSRRRQTTDSLPQVGITAAAVVCESQQFLPSIDSRKYILFLSFSTRVFKSLKYP